MLEDFTWFRQSALSWRGGLTVYVDPWGIPPGEPRADIVFLTHAHFDHLSDEDLARVRTERTIVVAPHDVAAGLLSGDVRAVKPGEWIEACGLDVQVVAAYNNHPDRLDAHPRDNNWVGYAMALGDARYYFAGDTDHTPELESVTTDVVFVPIGGTYTMDVEEAAAAVRKMRPKIAVPYHFGYVVGSGGDGERFVTAVAPVEGRVLTPRNPFER